MCGFSKLHYNLHKPFASKKFERADLFSSSNKNHVSFDFFGFMLSRFRLTGFRSPKLSLPEWTTFSSVLHFTHPVSSILRNYYHVIKSTLAVVPLHWFRYASCQVCCNISHTVQYVSTCEVVIESAITLWHILLNKAVELFPRVVQFILLRSFCNALFIPVNATSVVLSCFLSWGRFPTAVDSLRKTPTAFCRALFKVLGYISFVYQRYSLMKQGWFCLPPCCIWGLVNSL